MIARLLDRLHWRRVRGAHVTMAASGGTAWVLVLRRWRRTLHVEMDRVKLVALCREFADGEPETDRSTS